MDASSSGVRSSRARLGGSPSSIAASASSMLRTSPSPDCRKAWSMKAETSGIIDS